MVVFVVFADLGNDKREFHGVFSTRELAESCVKRKNKGYGFSICYVEDMYLDGDY